MEPLTQMAIISIICGLVLAATMYFVFQIAPAYCFFIGLMGAVGIFLIGLILSTFA